MEFFLGFFFGVICLAIYLNWFLGRLKRSGYITFECTDKLMEELGVKQANNNPINHLDE